MNFQDFFFEVNAESNALDLTVPKSSPLQRVSEGVGDTFVLTDLVIIYTCFGSSRSPVSLETTAIVSTKNVTEKGVDLFIKYLLRLILCGFLLQRRHL